MHSSASNKRHFIIIAIGVVLSTIVMGIFLLWALPLPTQASAQAATVDWVVHLNTWLIAFFFSLVVVFMVYAFVMFRRRKGDDSEGEHFEGHSALEIIWTAVPLVIVLVLGFIGWVTLREITAVQPNELVVNVTGFQWGWSFSYPNGTTSDELVLPVDQPALMEMTSKDVIHSFWVPQFRMKQDLVPGISTHLRFTPIELGTYDVRCAELCGLSHYNMVKPVRVVTQEEFAQWMGEQLARQNPGLADQADDVSESTN